MHPKNLPKNPIHHLLFSLCSFLFQSFGFALVCVSLCHILNHWVHRIFCLCVDVFFRSKLKRKMLNVKKNAYTERWIGAGCVPPGMFFHFSIEFRKQNERKRSTFFNSSFASSSSSSSSLFVMFSLLLYTFYGCICQCQCRFCVYVHDRVYV